MKILFFFSHPAQFLFSKNAIERLREKGHSVHTLIKTKDILSTLLDETGWEYYNLLPKERGNNKVSIVFSLIKRDWKLYRYVRKNKIQLLIGTDASLAHVGKLLGIPCITITEDDYDVIRHLGNLTYPFTTKIFAPVLCDVGKWDDIKIGYHGYMKLAYLHPNVFTPLKSKISVDSTKPYFIIRLSGLSAHHDFGIKGLSDEKLDQIIEKLLVKGDVYISSEKTLPEKYNKYLLKIPVSDIHHYLFFANMLICDSQSMAVEASMLGTPNIRISSFAGRISVLEELEHKYQLTIGIKPDDETIFDKIDELSNKPDLKEIYANRRQLMLNDKIDVTAYFTWLIDNYPKSMDVIKEKPEFQLSFK